MAEKDLIPKMMKRRLEFSEDSIPDARESFGDEDYNNRAGIDLQTIKSVKEIDHRDVVRKVNREEDAVEAKKRMTRGDDTYLEAPPLPLQKSTPKISVAEDDRGVDEGKAVDRDREFVDEGKAVDRDREFVNGAGDEQFHEFVNLDIAQIVDMANLTLTHIETMDKEISEAKEALKHILSLLYSRNQGMAIVEDIDIERLHHPVEVEDEGRTKVKDTAKKKSVGGIPAALTTLERITKKEPEFVSWVEGIVTDLLEIVSGERRETTQGIEALLTLYDRFKEKKAIFWKVLTKSDIFGLRLPWGLIATPQEVESQELEFEDEKVVTRKFTLTKRKPLIEKDKKLLLGGTSWSDYLSDRSLDATGNSTVTLYVDSKKKFYISSDTVTGNTVGGARTPRRTPRKNKNEKTPTKTTVAAADPVPDPLALGLMPMGSIEANFDPSMNAKSPMLQPSTENVPSDDDVPGLRRYI